MTNEQFDIIKEFIDEECNINKGKDLKKIIDYINSKINSNKENSIKDFIVIDDETFKELYDLLNTPFIEFYETNNPNSKNTKSLYNAFYLDNISRGNLIGRSEDLKVYHTLGIGSKIKINNHISDEAIEEYEHTLNKYGITYYTKLTDIQKLELEQTIKVKKRD